MRIGKNIFPGLLAAPVILLFVASCAGVAVKKSEAHTRPHEGDPILLGRALAYLEKGNLALARNDAISAEKYAKDSIDILPTFEAYYLLGMAARTLHKPDEALQALLKAETILPEEEQLLLTLGLLFSAKGDNRAALDRFDRLLKLKPADPVYNYRVGVFYKERKDYEKALGYLKKADLDGFEFRTQALMQLGDVCLELRRFDEADGYFERVRKANPADGANATNASRTARLLDQGNVAFRRKEYGAAESAYREAAALSPDSPTPLIQLGTVYLARNDSRKAKESFEQALKRRPESKDARALLASTARKLGDYSLSAKVLEEGLKQSPDDPELMNQLGLHHAGLGERERAAVVFEKVLQKQEGYMPARKNLLIQYIELGRMTDARRQLALIQKQEPANPEWKDVDLRIQIQEILERGHGFFRKGQYRKAENEYRRALALKKDYIPTFLALANAQMMSGDARGAEKSFRTVRKTEPENPEALSGLLALYGKTGDARARVSLEREIQQIGAQHPEVLLAFARQKEEAGQDAEAQSQYRALLGRMPGNAFILRRMAGIEIRLAIEKNRKNRFDEAASHIVAAAKLDPSHPALERNRAIIEENRRYRNLIPEIERAEAAYQKADYTLAEDIFARLYKQWPRPSFLVRLAEIRFETGREASGQAMLIEALKKDPVGLEFREALYSRLLDRRQLDEAEKGFRKILSEDESAYFSSYKLGIIDMLRRDYDEALAHLQQALLYRPDFLAARIARGVVFYEKNKPDEARREFEEAKKIEQRGQELALLNLAIMEWNAGSDRAEKALSQLALLYPDFADPHYHLAYIAYSHQQWREALDEINRAIDLERTPDYLYARIDILGKMRATRELQEASRDFLKEFPGDERSGNVRRILAASGGQKDFVEPALRYPTGNDAVYAMPASFLIVRGDDVLGVERGTDRVLFQRRGQIKSHIMDRWLLLLQGDRLFWIDPESGDEVRQVIVPPGSCSVTGDAENPVVLVAKNCNKGAGSFRNLAGDRDRPAPAGASLISFGPGRYVVAEGNRLTGLDQNLKEVGTRWTAPAAITRIHSFRDAGASAATLVAVSGDRLVFLSENLKVEREVALGGRSVVLDGTILLYKDSTVDQLAANGKTLQTFRLPSAATRGIFPAGRDRLAFIDADGELVLVDSSGKVFLRETMKKNEASVFRLYSAADTQ